MSSMNPRADRSNRRRKMNLVLDLNVVPPDETEVTEGGPSALEVPAPLVVDESDDEVIICSPRFFEEATARRNRRRLAVNPEMLAAAENQAAVVAEVQTAAVAEVRTVAVAEVRTVRSLRPRAINAEVRTAPLLRPRETNADIMNWETSDAVFYIKPPPPSPPSPPPSPPPPPALTCPICMAPFQEEMTTRCGHIFCKRCIRTAIHKQPKCPTCRKKVTMKELIRVFLPSPN